MTEEAHRTAYINVRQRPFNFVTNCFVSMAIISLKRPNRESILASTELSSKGGLSHISWYPIASFSGTFVHGYRLSPYQSSYPFSVLLIRRFV